jgi:DNA replication initiation complex subunit (GINS family)
MSNYPNMSYCMCENTLLAMKQILGTMQDEGPMFLREMSREERRAYDALFNMCEEFLSATEELQEQLEYEERDGQPTEQEEWHDFDPEC